MLTLDTDSRALFAADVAASLQRRPRELSSKYFYDALGTSLFEAICQLPWYRITRAESALLARHAAEILAPYRDALRLAELGCGSGAKLATLVREGRARVERVHLVDVSLRALDMARTEVLPLVSDVAVYPGSYEDGLCRLEAERDHRPLVVLFLGSNIGNFDRPAAQSLLRRIRDVLRPGDALLLGSDLTKPIDDLLLAYDDPLQVTAAFNRNILRRINDELGGTFDLDGFAHRACWNARERRIEMHLVSTQAQRVRIEAIGLHIDFDSGDSIWTESSYKYEPAEILEAGRSAGFGRGEHWIDEAARFALTRFGV